MKINGLSFTTVADASLASERADKAGAGDAFAALFAAADQASRTARSGVAAKPSSRAIEAVSARTERQSGDRVEADEPRPDATRRPNGSDASSKAPADAEPVDETVDAATANPAEDRIVDESEEPSDVAAADDAATMLVYVDSSVAIERTASDAAAADGDGEAGAVAKQAQESGVRSVAPQQPTVSPVVDEAADADAADDADVDRLQPTVKAEPAKPQVVHESAVKGEPAKDTTKAEAAVADRVAQSPTPQTSATSSASSDAALDEAAAQDAGRFQQQSQSDANDSERQAQRELERQPEVRSDSRTPQVRVGAEVTQASDDAPDAEKPAVPVHPAAAARAASPAEVPANPPTEAAANTGHAASAASHTGASVSAPHANQAAAANGGEAATQQPMSDADSSRVADQAMRGLRGALMQRGGSVTLRLNPAELGELKIQVQMSGGAVRAQIEAGNEGTRSMLQQHLSSLRAALASHGLTVEQLSVSAATPSHQSAFNGGEDTADDGRSRGGFDQSRDSQSGRRDGDRDPNHPRGFNQRLLDLVA